MKRVLSLAVAATLLASLTACSANTGLVSGSSVAIGELSAATSLNTDVEAFAANEAVNGELANLTTAGFYSNDNNGQLTPNQDFGSVEVVKTSPFTVKYLLTGKADWSDGEPITATDLLLSWAAAVDHGKTNFKSSRFGNGLLATTGVPKVGDSDLSLSIEFSRPIADYKTALTLPVAAHTLGQLAFEKSHLDAKAASAKVLDAIQKTNTEDLKTLAKTYRQAFQLDSGFSLQPELGVTSGAYQVASASSKSITLKANAKNNAMPSARAETITMAFYGSALQMVSDLKSAKLDLAGLVPSATESNTAITDALKAAAKSGVTNKLIGTNLVETVLFNQAPGSSFSADSFGAADSKDSLGKALLARQAFMNLISTSKIQTLISANQSVQDAKSFVFTPDSSYYQSTIQDSGVLAYQFADNQKAYNALNNLDHRVTVRVLFDINNPRAQIEYSTLAEKSEEVGFGLSNVSSPDPHSILQSGAYDVYLAPQPVLGESGADFEQALAHYTAAGPTLDANVLDAFSQFAKASDDVTRAAALKTIDAELVATAYGLPLYQLPIIVAHSKKFAVTPDLIGDSSLTAGYATWNLAG